MDYKYNINSLNNNLFIKFKEFMEGNLLKDYPKLKIVSSSNIATYPRVVFSEDRNRISSNTTRMELKKRNLEFEVNIYAIDTDEQIADEIIDDISNCALYYLEEVLKIPTDITRITDFDDKGTQNRRLIIRFDIKWLQQKNIIK